MFVKAPGSDTVNQIVAAGHRGEHAVQGFTMKCLVGVVNHVLFLAFEVRTLRQNIIPKNHIRSGVMC